MADLRLYDIVSPIVVTFDLLQKRDGLIDETEALATAVIVALGTNRRALSDDLLPDAQLTNDTDRRGWWADSNVEEIWNGWPIGCRLWLLDRHKITGREARQGSTLARIDTYIREALQPFVDRRICTSFDIEVTRVELQKIVARIVIWRGPLPAIELQFQNLVERDRSVSLALDNADARRGAQAKPRLHYRALALGGDGAQQRLARAVRRQWGLAFLVLLYIDWLALQLLPDTAETEWLDRHAAIWLPAGGRKPATFASGSVTATGINGSILPQGSQLTGSGGGSGSVLYETLSQITVGTGPTPVDVRAVDPGVAGNLDQGSSLAFVNAIAGIDGSVTVVTMDGGVDIESDDELRERVLERIQQPPMGGARV